MIVLCIRTFWYQIHACRVTINWYIWEKKHIAQIRLQNFTWAHIQMRFSKLPTMNSDSQPSFSNSQYTLLQEKIGCSLFYGGEGLHPFLEPFWDSSATLPATEPDGAHGRWLREAPDHRCCLRGLVCCQRHGQPPTPPRQLRCKRWLATYTWLTWYAPCWKADASSWCWTGRRAVGDANETDYHREVYWHRCCSTSTPTTSPYTPTHAASYSQTTRASRHKEILQQHRIVIHICPEHYDHTLWHEPTACEPFKDTDRCVLST